MKTTSSLGVIVLAGAFVAATGATPSGQSASVGPAVKPAAVAKKAGAPPQAGSKTTTVAGKNRTKFATANQPGDDDSFWIEGIDVDGDGDVEDANVVWDDEDKVLFTYTTGTLTCKNGGTASGDLLIAINADGNPRKRPTGSGFWLADLDAGECGVQAAALWGCRFDATGNETACGVAAIDEKNDDIVISAAKKSEYDLVRDRPASPMTSLCPVQHVVHEGSSAVRR
jgi:hypothetical protein